MASVVSPNVSPIVVSAVTAASRSSAIAPPEKFAPSSRPSTRLASETVGSVPPSP